MRVRRFFCIVAMLPWLCSGAIAGEITESISTFNIGPEGGSFLSLIADNQNPGTLYVGARNTGVFKTTDGGAHWRSAGLGGGLSVIALAIAQDASALYALAGFDNLDGRFVDVKVFKSRDGGESWTAASSSLPSECYLGALVVDSQHSGTLYVSACGSVFKSTNAGETWSPASNGLQGIIAQRLAIDPQDSNII